MPRDLYELMLDALRQTRASVASPVIDGREARQSTRQFDIGLPDVAQAMREVEPDIEIPRDVADSITLFAAGDPLEEAACYTRAIALLKAGRKSADVIRELRQGANPEAFI